MLEWVLLINCNSYVWLAHKDEFYTSGTCNKLVTKQGRNKFEVNVRTVASFREVGKGLESIKNFSRCMNMSIH